MAESIIKDFKGKNDWVYVGKSEAPKPSEKKADTLFHQYMQEVFDVAAPVMIGELDGAAGAQAALASATLSLADKAHTDATSTASLPDKSTFAKRWLALEQRVSNDDHQNRLGKLLTSFVYMGGSFAMNLGSEVVADVLYRGKSKVPLPLGRSINISKETGNQRMLDAGWEYLTDYGVEKTVDWSAQKLANRENIGFVSPLSRAISKIGNTIINATRNFDEHNFSTAVKRSLLNPGFIEGAFRFAGALPGGGFIKELYGKANKQIMKGEGVIPLGADLAFNMIFAKVLYKMQQGGAKP